MDKEQITILEDTFEKAYTDYKEYNSYVTSEAKVIEKERQDFAKYVSDNKKNIEEVLDKMYDINEKPSLHKADLFTLQVRLINIYETVKYIIDIPKDVKEEINSLVKPRLHYKIEDGKPVEINKEANKESRKFAKEKSLEFVKQLMKSK